MIMKNRALAMLTVSLGVFAATVPLMAHHSFAAEYDSNKKVTLKGVVTKVEWMNPHAYFYVDVRDESTDKVINWAFEMGPPRLLEKQGWTKNTMKEGDEVTVVGTLAKDGNKQGNAQTVTMTNTGKRLGAASSQFTKQE
jgi:hypothetical protein